MTDQVLALRERLLELPRRRRTLLVAIDGRGGAGKSTLARALGGLEGATTIVAIDDFYRRSLDREDRQGRGDTEIGGAFDWRRLREQVLQPLAQDNPARYRHYDWDEDRLAEWRAVEPGGVVIVEGSYSTRSELRGFYDFTIWVDAPHEVRLQRGIERDGEAARSRWLDEWMPEEERYIAAERSAESCDLVIDGGR